MHTRVIWKVSDLAFNRRKTRDKRLLGRDPDRSWCHLHTSLKLLWSRLMAPWTSAAAYEYATAQSLSSHLRFENVRWFHMSCTPCVAIGATFILNNFGTVAMESRFSFLSPPLLQLLYLRSAWWRCVLSPEA